MKLIDGMPHLLETLEYIRNVQSYTSTNSKNVFILPS